MPFMDEAAKAQLLREASFKLSEIRSSAGDLIPVTEKRLAGFFEELRRTRESNATSVLQNLIQFANLKLDGLRNAEDSPYFARCDVSLEDGAQHEWYFGKFSIPELDVYSWTVPAARIRFESPGRYEIAIDEVRRAYGALVRNDQYLIAQGAITFMSVETESMLRTLIYHENFSSHKSEFALVEIVERMEKAQDEVIRADPRGPLLISGPAGSGKTTLALHRIAYLLQVPEQAEAFTPESMLVLVQDDTTKKYFESLLPSLGIRHVSISTFASWALKILGLKGFNVVFRFGDTEEERDTFEYAKYQAVEAFEPGKVYEESPLSILQRAYATYLDPSMCALLALQQKQKLLDRFDLAILLAARTHQDGGSLQAEQRVSETTSSGRFKTRTVRAPLSYSLILVDEVQNYLPAHIRILRSCVSAKTRAITYIGDLAQQTSLFTLKTWTDSGEDMPRERTVSLEKVYRSTRQIMEYIRSAGFDVSIPPGLREGNDVKVCFVRSDIEAYEQIAGVIESHPEVLVGVVGLTPESIERYRMLSGEHVRVLTIHEAQGVEFDVCIVIAPDDSLYEHLPESLRTEKKKTVRDQYYVGLTRAVNELYIVTIEKRQRSK